MGINQRSQVVMTEDEIQSFLSAARTATLATIGATGRPHLVAMWFGLVDGQVCFETKAKSQKAVNVRRDPAVTCMVETGDTYDCLRGISIEGHATIVDDPSDPRYWRAASSLFERYYGPVDNESRAALETMMTKRLVVIIEPERLRSWDHRKLQLPEMPITGSTAASLEHLRRAR